MFDKNLNLMMKQKGMTLMELMIHGADGKGV